MALKGTAFRTERPDPSVMSNCSGSDQEKQCSRLATLDSTKSEPNEIPIHTRRPDPKGKRLKFLPEKSVPACSPSSRNLSGSKSIGFAHTAGSLPMAHTLTRSRVFAGMAYPKALHSAVDWWGMRSGMTGWSRNASFTTALIYLRFGMSESCTLRICPTIMSSSACAFDSTCGLRRISAMVHSVASTDVSIPAAKASW